MDMSTAYVYVYIYTHTLIHAFIPMYIYICVCVEGSLEVKLPTIWTEVGRVREEKKKEE